MDILVVSGCSGDKVYDDAPIGCREIDSASREDLILEYPDYVTRASEMYEGDEHGCVRRAVSNLRGYADVSWRILSAGYGLLDEDDEIVAYDCTLSDIEPVMERAKRTGHVPEALTHDEARRAVGRDKQMVRGLREALAGGYDLAFIVLSEPYYVAISEALGDIPSEITVVAFASKGFKKYLGDAYWAPATEEVRAELGSNNFRLRGEILKNASENMDESGLSKIIRQPETIVEIVPALQNAARE
jgi:hypothetical protein